MKSLDRIALARINALRQFAAPLPRKRKTQKRAKRSNGRPQV
jgi:hypothetical protein